MFAMKRTAKKISLQLFLESSGENHHHHHHHHHHLFVHKNAVYKMTMCNWRTGHARLGNSS